MPRIPPFLSVIGVALLVACGSNTSETGSTGPGGGGSGGTGGTTGAGAGPVGGGPAGGGGMAPEAFEADWLVAFGDQGGDQIAYDVAVDSSDAIVVVGEFDGTLDIGGGNAVTTSTRGTFVAKLASNGIPEWIRSFDGLDFYPAIAVAIDSADDIFVTAEHQAGFDLGDGPIGNPGVFLLKLDGDGNTLWGSSFGTMGGNRFNALAVDANDDILAIGGLHNTLDFGPAGVAQSSGNLDLLLAKFDGAVGTPLWHVNYGNTIQQELTSGWIQSTGHIVASGYHTSGTFQAGGETLEGTFWIRFDAAGVPMASQSTTTGWGTVTSSGPNDAIVLAGSDDGPLDFGEGPLPGVGVFAASFDATGSHRWSDRFGMNGLSFARDVVTTSDGRCIFTGWYDGELALGGAPLSAPNYRGFFGEYGSDGAFISQLEASSWLRTHAMAVMSDDDLVIVGQFPPAGVEIGGRTITGAGGADMFVGRLSKP